MADTSVSKIDSKTSPRGPDGRIYLASGTHASMCLWLDEAPSESKPPASREYETVGYVLKGKAEYIPRDRSSL